MSPVPEKAIRRQITVLIPVYTNALMNGTAIGWLSNAIYFLMIGDEVYATTSQTTLIASSLQFGKILFAIPAGILTDEFGRKKITSSIAILNVVAYLGLSLNTSLTLIYVGRFIIGVATALLNAAALTSIGEIASPEIRGKLSNFFQIFTNIGVITPSIISVIFSSYKILSWSLAILSVINLLSMFWLTETPNFLVSVSKLDKAKNNLKLIRLGYQEEEINAEYEKLKKYIEDEKTRKSQSNWMKFLRSKSIRKPLLIGILLNSFSVLTGSFVIRTYITAIIPSNEFVPKKYYPLINQILVLFLSTIPTFYIDRFPRKTLYLFGAVSMILINALCAVSHFFMIECQTNFFFKLIFLLGNILVMVSYGTLIKPVTNAINSEIYPHAVKGFCGSMVNMSQGLSLIIGFQLYSFVNDHLHFYFMYVIFLINSILLYLVIHFWLPESGGTSLTDFQMKFNKETTSIDCVNGEKNSLR